MPTNVKQVLLILYLCWSYIFSFSKFSGKNSSKHVHL